MEVNQSNTSSGVWPGEGSEGSQSEHTVEQCDKPVLSGPAIAIKEVCISKQQEAMANRNQNGISSSSNETHKKEGVEAMDIDQTNKDEAETVLHKVCNNQVKHIEGERAMKEGNETSRDLKCVSNHSQGSQSEIKHTDRNRDAPVASSSKDDERHVHDSLLPITCKEAMNVLEEINR
jgi:hypothetical protein